MLLAELFDDPGLPGAEVTALAYDNRQVGPGTVFCAVPGFMRDGHDFASDAVARGAVALLVQRPLGLGVPEVVVDDVRVAMAAAAARLAGDPTRELRMCGVTGTNGKTTTAYLVRALLEAAGLRTGLLGTVTQVVGGVETAAVRTTPEAIDLQRQFRAMVDAGDRACAMEVSSHALELHRADAIDWDVAVFTNLSQDHLDFHPDMEAYFRAKRRLFEAGPRTAVVNVDDGHGARLARELDGPALVTVALDADADLRPSRVQAGPAGSVVDVDGLELRVPLPGRFNVLNALGAVAAARALGVDDATIAAALPTARTAPGRFEPVDEGQRFAVLVDYAHTPEALDNVLVAARELTSGRVLVVFGAGGDRDRAKRPLMGAAAAAHADVVVVTSDNPRSEEPRAIIDEVLAGTTGARGEVVAVEDRREAIGHAVAAARDGDVVVVAGKGHEQGQELAGGVKVPFDDVQVAREALRARLVA
ncbi:UDP-N-acetylmuramoyl-L-alanyl-D-glutamate--2,6-diaminopimelate ligase [Conexibacter sp. SYSU D00693]|uniref:UDP-N-acetylmuramoyl-L-alanyl-D-glutamate--2, 6-diaminopimelate ligase n=1 Tax=Conexibacter sp. SYSU D00693 TaxID=2812560 RepID=UPI00196AB525|nr:UDP-N-acetylmuramoyl-L-alanyl-D-glutamate--2,6-diaminopimelate ligase [Conexibacter sp. SYSU D00693]